VFGEFCPHPKFAKHEKPNRNPCITAKRATKRAWSEPEPQRGRTAHTPQTQPAQAGGASRKIIPPTQFEML